MRRRLAFAMIIVGLSGIIAQILILRELMITFYGNELSIGIILANWLILEAIGAFLLGKKAERVRKKFEIFIILNLIFLISFPIMIYLARIVKDIMGLTPGEGVGLVPMLCSSFLILLPVSISHGALFTFGCKIYSLYSDAKDAVNIGRVYIYETLGTMAGGIGFTYLLIPYFHSITIALSVSLLNVILCLWLLFPFRRYKRDTAKRNLSFLSLGCSFLIGFFLFGGGADVIHIDSINNQWKGQHLVHYQNSIYGNVAVIEREGQYTFFSDGVPIITTPFPDISFVEWFIHMPMLLHSNPENILVLSGGAGGVIHEILKHPSVKKIDYTELDPLILATIAKFNSPLTEKELGDEKVQVINMDGRVFVKTSPSLYDVIFVGLGEPSDLQTNRFFTTEFFSLAKKRLSEDGLLIISLPGSLSYLGRELESLNACIVHTLNGVFPYVNVVPGDFNLFIASSSEDILQFNVQELNVRLAERGLDTGLITPAYIDYMLSSRHSEWFFDRVNSGTKRLNSDFSPIGFFYSLSYRNAMFSPYMRKPFLLFEGFNIAHFCMLCLIIILTVILIGRRTGQLSRISVPICVAMTGFSGMIFSLVLIFAFQALYGYVFHWIGLLVSTLMVGTALGGFMMTHFLGKKMNELTLFMKLEICLILFSVILPLVFTILHPYIDRPSAFLLKSVFLGLSFVSGFLIGLQFPLANKMYLTFGMGKQKHRFGDTVGLLYGSDLLGGWMGGILGGVILLPVLGLLGTCVIVVIAKVAGLIIFSVSRPI